MGYRKITLDITPAQVRKAATGQAISLSAAQLKGSGVSMHVHPETYKKIESAKRANRGTRIQIMPGEIEHDLMQGGSLWSFLKNTANSVGSFVKNNWSSIKPLVSKGLDAAVQPLSEMAGPYAPAVIMGRQALRGLAGVGVAPPQKKLIKGSQAARDHMAKLRSMRRGGSFRLH